MNNKSFANTEPPRPTQYKGLADLMIHAEHYAWFTLKNSGSTIHPVMVMLTDTGMPAMFPFNGKGDFGDPLVRDRFAMTCRMAAAATGSTATVLITEAWMTCAKPGTPLDMLEPPSEAFERQEIVSCMGESHVGQQSRILPIIRQSGKFFGFGPDDFSKQVDRVEGRFTRLLPPPGLPPELRAAATMGLKLLGYSMREM